MTDIIISSLINLLLIMGGPVLVVLLLTFINRNTKQLIANTLGVSFQVYLGGIGVCLHELSHLVMALIFGHRIQSFKLLVMPWNLGKNGANSMGYVNHSWNEKSAYQSLGNLFVGTAPIWGCTAALLGLSWLMIPDITSLSSQLTLSPDISVLAASVWNLLRNFMLTKPLWFSLWLVLSINITVGGFDLSFSDFQGAAKAFVEVYLLLLAVIFIAAFLGYSATVSAWIIKILFWMAVVMTVSFVWSILANLLVRLTSLIR